MLSMVESPIRYIGLKSDDDANEEEDDDDDDDNDEEKKEEEDDDEEVVSKEELVILGPMVLSMLKSNSFSCFTKPELGVINDLLAFAAFKASSKVRFWVFISHATIIEPLRDTPMHLYVCISTYIAIRGDINKEIKTVN